MKTCSKCGEVKGVSCFNKHIGYRYNVSSVCKSCTSIVNKEYREKNKENINKKRRESRERNRPAVLEKEKAWRDKNKETISGYNREYNKKEENKEKRKTRDAKYKEAFPEKIALQAKNSYRKRCGYDRENIRATNRASYARNRETVLAYQREYRELNKTKINDRMEIYRAKPEIRAVLNIRRRVSLAIFEQGGAKHEKTMELVGCSKPFVRSHIEKQFSKGMTWDNYGIHGWHIDHIRPCASFDLTDPEQQKQCFHYTNLQPLWAEDNLRKSDKWSGE